MRKTIVVATLLLTVCPPAVAKDLPTMGEEEAVTTSTLELVDQKKTIKVACEMFQLEIRPPDDTSGQSTFLDCRAPLDTNTPLLWDYAKSKHQLDKATVSVKPWEGPLYTIELPNVTIDFASITDNSMVSINVRGQ
jgi:hypothetical protein